MRESIRTYIYMLKYTKNSRILYVLGILMFTSQIFTANFVQASFLRILSSSVIQMDSNILIQGIIKCSVLFIIQIVLVLIGIACYNLASIKIERNFKSSLFKGFLNSNKLGSNATEAISKINNDSDLALNVLGNSFAFMMFSIITIVGSSIVIFFIDIRIFILQIIILVLSVVVPAKSSDKISVITHKELDLHEKSLSIVTSIIRGNETIRANNYQSNLISKYVKAINVMYKQSYLKLWIFVKQYIFKTVFSKLSVIGVFAIGSYFVYEGTIDFPSFIMLPVMCLGVTDAASNLGREYAALKGPLAAVNRLSPFLENKEPVVDQTKISYGKGVLRVKNLSHKFNDEYLYINLNFQIEKGDFVVIIGESGSGKSTLLKSIMGLDNSYEGDIFLDTNLSKTVEGEFWREYFSYVDQECRLFNMSIKDNITLLDDSIELSDVFRVIEHVQLSTYISKLPEGIDTIISDKSDNLSGGERQRIVLARALIRKTPILLLDEFTSSLDKTTEKEILNVLLSLREKYTIIISTHNVDLVSYADQIIDLDKFNINKAKRKND